MDKVLGALVKLNRRDFLTAAGSAAALASTPALAIGRDGYLVSSLELRVKGLDPAHDGLLIAQLSDLHVGVTTPDSRVLAAVDQVNATKPDLVLLTGDFVTYCPSPLPDVPRLLGGISAPTFVVLGNHDHFVDAPRLRRDLEREGYTVLQNQHTLTRLRGAPIAVLGVDDSSSGHDDVSATFKGAPRDGTRIVLAHTPTSARDLPPQSDLVCFSGHTHGGQIVIPPITDTAMAKFGQPYVRGLYEVNGNQLYVNRGLGFGRKRELFHHGSEPELAFITLRAAT